MPGLRLLLLDHLSKSFIHKIALNTFWKTSGLAPLGGGGLELCSPIEKISPTILFYFESEVKQGGILKLDSVIKAKENSDLDLDFVGISAGEVIPDEVELTPWDTPIQVTLNMSQ